MNVVFYNPEHIALLNFLYESPTHFQPHYPGQGLSTSGTYPKEQSVQGMPLQSIMTHTIIQSFTHRSIFSYTLSLLTCFLVYGKKL